MLAIARGNHGLAVLNGSLYAVGGQHTDGSYLSSVEMSDGGAWRNAPSMLSTRSHLAVAVFNNLLFAVGGINSAHLNTMEVFDGKKWSLAPSMITARIDHGIGVFGGFLYVLGGVTRTPSVKTPVFLDSVEMFDGTAWTSGLSMPTTRFAFEVLAL